ncbi:hypothetical protein EV175_005180, partial [Coemansia sp. RSA 1933]
SSEIDTLASMLDERPQITVGEPAPGSEATNTPEEDEDSSTVDEQNGDGDKAQEGDGAGSGTVVLYLSESTMTSTEIVYMTEYLTEDDTDFNALYTYGAGIQTRGQLSTTLGPYVKPLFGTNVGLTIDPDPVEATISSGGIAQLSFTDDLVSPWPTGSAKWMGSESLDYIAPPLPGPASPSPSNIIDVLMASSTGSAMNGVAGIADTMSPAGTPLFSNSHQVNSIDLSTASINADPPLAQEDSATAAEMAIVTNRPSYRSVTNKTNKDMLNHAHSSRAEPPAPHATTVLSTVTMDGKPVLQVVVSMDSSVVPESLTIAY